MKVFPIHGLYVERSDSNATHLTLSRAEPTLSGRYSCEVSADAPSFHTFLVSGDMDVVEVPSERPSISGVRPRYRIGDVLHVNCSSTWSRPAAKLAWVVNDMQALPSHLVHYPARKEPHSDRESPRLGLHIVVKPHHFEAGRLKIRCIASIHDVYWQSTEKSVEEERPKGISLGAVGLGPNFLPPPAEPTTAHPRFMDDSDEDVDVRGRRPPIESISPRGYFPSMFLELLPLLLFIIR